MFNFFLKRHTKNISIAFFFIKKGIRKLIENLCQRKMLQLFYVDQTEPNDRIFMVVGFIPRATL